MFALNFAARSESNYDSRGSVRSRTDVGSIFVHPLSVYAPVLVGILFVFFFRGSAAGQGSPLLSLDQAIDLALTHNHPLKATRTLILQNQAQEITANLRPNPTLGADSQFVPIFNPQYFSAENLDQIQQFDIGIGYLFERGHKRPRRLQAARDQTDVTRAQVADTERALTFNVGQQFVG